MIRRFARPYARAIMDTVKSSEKAAALRDELTTFEQARKSSHDLQQMYANPGIDFDSKHKVTAAIATHLGLSELAMRLLDVLIQNRRINDLGVIVAGLATMIREATGTVAAEVRSASELSEKEQGELRAMLERKVGGKVDIDVSVDPALIGGFVAKIGSEVFDASVSGKIEKFRASLA
ncbi:MAG: F-type H+-transporting ATPase subunit delta [Thermoanaerobaculia bacterium]|jgi:F-type H+-transporting ATPase subunit delta|nr:F-type H+-transporting ATPase subunit delta [Thermoanaerobaculia bacterium]